MASSSATSGQVAPEAPATSLDVARQVLAPGAGAEVSYLAVGRPAPRFLLPDDRTVAASACTGYNSLRPRRTRIQRRVSSWAVRLGLGGLIGSPEVLAGVGRYAGDETGSLVDHLGDRLGRRVTAAVGLGSLDAYWTPVLQLFGDDGAPVAYAKVGWNPVTRAFVDREWDASVALSAAEVDVIAPAPLHRGSWGELELSVLAPMPADVVAVPDRAVPVVPRSLETLDGPIVARRVTDSRWWAAVVASVEAAAGIDGIPSCAPLLDGVAEELSESVDFGRMHGDWVPWNLGTSGRSLVAWDWEYSERDAPLGVDVVHGRYQVSRLLDGRSDRDAFDDAAPAGSAALLHPLMVLSRRCWTSAMLGHPDGLDELSAAAHVLGERLGIDGGR